MMKTLFPAANVGECDQDPRGPRDVAPVRSIGNLHRPVVSRGRLASTAASGQSGPAATDASENAALKGYGGGHQRSRLGWLLCSVVLLSVAIGCQHQRLSTKNLPPTAPPSNPQATRNQPSSASPSNPQRALSAIPEEPPETGPGWRDGEYLNAMAMDNRRGRDVHRPVKNRRNIIANADAGTGNGNYLLTIPLLNLRGRGLPLSLNLYYNSLLWQETAGNTFVFDHDFDWPAPGWSLGFGQLYMAGSSAFILQDADAARHLCVGAWGSTVVVNGMKTVTFDGKTNDGTLEDCHITYGYTIVVGGQEFYPIGGQVDYANGAVVQYKAGNGGGFFPTLITDSNGNFITIAYGPNGGPAITTIQDTLGRTITFNYDSNNHLISISAPGVGTSSRSLVFLHYAQLSLNYAFAGQGGIVRPGESTFSAIDAIYFPGDSSGYWFGDPDSYSSYGMIAKVSQRHAMAAPSGAQGQILPGTMTHERVYNYPGVNGVGSPLSDVPSYTTMTESWFAMDVPPAVTSFSLQKLPTGPPLCGAAQELTTSYPDGTRSYAYTCTDTTSFLNGLAYDQLIDGGTPAVLSQIQTTYAKGDYQSPRVTTIQKTNVLGQSTSTVFTYCTNTVVTSCSGPNQMINVTELGYPINGAPPVLRQTSVVYVDNANYSARHIFNLPFTVMVYDGAGTALAQTNYIYDGQPLANTPSVTNYSDPGTNFRGNLTQIGRVLDPGNLDSGVTENRNYDITGNLISSVRGASETLYLYTRNTDYAYPETIRITSPQVCPGLCAVSQAFTYNYSTGLVTSSTDANGRTTQYTYDAASLRSTGITLPTGATEALSYDDVNLKKTDARFNVGNPPQLATRTVTSFNGLGLPVSVESLTDGNATNVVATQYDTRGRVAKTSLPYRAGSQQPAWTSFTYDGLGRVTIRQLADGSQFVTSYDEAQQPSTATGAAGDTARSTDPWGRENWYRLDALGNLAEVVEPNPSGSGSVMEPGNMLTKYTFDAMGRLTLVSQGEQQRKFQYDALGNLTAEYLPEKSPSLDNLGHHVTSGVGQWSDVFTYDDRSNLISHTDARGVKTNYIYAGDPLDRVHQITYDLTGAWDASNPITPIPNVFFEYMSSGDIRRLAAVDLLQASNQSWCRRVYAYDGEGRLASDSSTCLAGQPLAVDYGYDSLSRIVSRTYPAEYGTPALARRVVTNTMGVGNTVTAVKLDGAPVASQITYDPPGPVASMVMADLTAQSTVDAFSYDPQTGLLSAQTVKQGNTDLLDLSYSYRGPGQTNGQLTNLTDNLDLTRQQAFIYDELGRLVTLVGSNLYQMSYGYNRYGNRTSVSVVGAAADGTTIPFDGLPALNYDLTTNHICTAGPPTTNPICTFSYDAAGNATRAQAADGTWLRYRYDSAGHLAAVLTDDGNTIIESYSYGADGRRLMVNSPASSGSTTYFAWDRNRVIAEYRTPVAGGNLFWSKSSVYLRNRILANVQPGTSGNLVQFLHTDRRGVRLITNNSTLSATSQVTLPFGTLLPQESSSDVNPIFTSYERSLATGRDYAINRFYDPQTRFLQVDPAGMSSVSPANPQTLNLYGYATDDPVNRTDPAGLDSPWTFIGIGVSIGSKFFPALGPWAAGYQGLNYGFQLGALSAPYSATGFEDEPGAGTPLPGDFPAPSMPYTGTPSAGTPNIDCGCGAVTPGLSESVDVIEEIGHSYDPNTGITTSVFPDGSSVSVDKDGNVVGMDLSEPD
jgi:RHS repeat-associated protein